MPTGSEARDGAGDRLLDPLRADPEKAAVLTDIDGTLAPIAARPEEAAVPQRASEALRRLASRYAIVACVSGRQALEARRLAGVDELAYAGNHGLEVLLPGEHEPRLDPSLGDRSAAAAELVARLDAGRLGHAGLRVEDKGPIQALHWRGAPDEGAAETLAREIAGTAGEELEPHWGRKVLELRPAGGVGKHTAVGALLSLRPVAAAVYAGDDRTDLDAFRRLRELRDAGALTTAVCVGIASTEGPAGVTEQADVVVDGPDGWIATLEALAA